MHVCVCVSVCVCDRERKRQTERQIPHHPLYSSLPSHLLCRSVSVLSWGSPPPFTGPHPDSWGRTHIHTGPYTWHPTPQQLFRPRKKHGGHWSLVILQRAKDAEIIVSKGSNFLDDLTPQICREQISITGTWQWSLQGRKGLGS